MCIVDSINIKMREQQPANGESNATAVVRPRIHHPDVQNEDDLDIRGIKLVSNILRNHQVIASSSTECLSCFHDVCVPFAPSHLCQRSPGEPPPPTLDR
ncbi:hypothetical protein X975_02542, partial [Stegodyphus mimosarum]